MQHLAPVEEGNAVRDIETNAKRMDAARKNSDLQNEKLEAEQKKFEHGMSTNFQVLDFQEDLAIAQSQVLRALLDYTKSQISLDRSTGELLDTWNISISE